MISFSYIIAIYNIILIRMQRSSLPHIPTYFMATQQNNLAMRARRRVSDIDDDAVTASGEIIIAWCFHTYNQFHLSNANMLFANTFHVSALLIEMKF